MEGNWREIHTYTKLNSKKKKKRNKSRVRVCCGCCYFFSFFFSLFFIISTSMFPLSTMISTIHDYFRRRIGFINVLRSTCMLVFAITVRATQVTLNTQAKAKQSVESEEDTKKNYTVRPVESTANQRQNSTAHAKPCRHGHSKWSSSGVGGKWQVKYGEK